MKPAEKTLSIPDKQRKLIEDFSVFPDWTEKYEYLIGLGKALPPMDEKDKVDENLIKGCQSRVWLHPESRNGRIYFSADSDALITKGLISMITGIFSGHSPTEIAGAGLEFIDKIGLREHLSPTRSNGLLNMMKQIKYYALAFLAKE